MWRFRQLFYFHSLLPGTKYIAKTQKPVFHWLVFSLAVPIIELVFFLAVPTIEQPQCAASVRDSIAIFSLVFSPKVWSFIQLLCYHFHLFHVYCCAAEQIAQDCQIEANKIPHLIFVNWCIAWWYSAINSGFTLKALTAINDNEFVLCTIKGWRAED